MNNNKTNQLKIKKNKFTTICCGISQWSSRFAQTLEIVNSLFMESHGCVTEQ